MWEESKWQAPQSRIWWQSVACENQAATWSADLPHFPQGDLSLRVWKTKQFRETTGQSTGFTGSPAGKFRTGLLPQTAGSTNNCLLVNNNDYPFRSQTQAPAISASLAFPFQIPEGSETAECEKPFLRSRHANEPCGQAMCSKIQGQWDSILSDFTNWDQGKLPKWLGQAALRTDYRAVSFLTFQQKEWAETTWI